MRWEASAAAAAEEEESSALASNSRSWEEAKNGDEGKTLKKRSNKLIKSPKLISQIDKKPQIHFNRKTPI